ncbi:MAG: selenocysteine-specific translation elongation factor [Planctomycetota bacterium]|jgi:selenocysteine-specific elongation factor
MAASQINITLGTAGHIDHGKTALIKCLTGCETDLLKAEKERGMSIELGFAPCTLADIEVGIVDVPGHENFIKTMVAGATGIDGVIFVVAADDGVMPQTREHLDILTLLGVKYGIVALTKADCVESDELEVVAAKVRDFLKGTFLESAPILPVSSVTGAGFDNFYEALKVLVKTIEPKRIDGVFRLPIERTFSIKGYGTVVTGIPVSGSAKIGDDVLLLPQGVKGRVKAIQVYKREAEAVMSGQCAAINVPQWDHKTIIRGNVVTQGKYFSPSQWYLCKLRVLPYEKLCFKTGCKMKFLTGTSEVVTTMYLMDANTATAGKDYLAQFRLQEPVVAGPRDRFILRTPSPARTVGGGMVIEAIPKRLKRSKPEVLQEAMERARAVTTEKDFVEYCIKTAATFAATERELSLRIKTPPANLKKILNELIADNNIIGLGSNLYVHSRTAAKIELELLDIVADFHRAQPESPGIGTDKVGEASALRKDVFDGIINLLISQGTLVLRKHRLALSNHRESFSEDDRRLMEQIESLFSEQLFNPPKFEEIIRHTKDSPAQVQKTLRILTEQAQLVQVDRNLLFHRRAVAQARERLTSFIGAEGRLESVKFKYLLDTTRKFALPLLDYFDQIGVTRRVGNTRYLKKPPETAPDSQT